MIVLESCGVPEMARQTVGQIVLLRHFDALEPDAKR